MAGYKIAIRHLSLQREIKVPKGKLPLIWLLTEKISAINAVRLLSKGENYTLDVIADGYDTKLTAFEVLIPALILSFENNLRKILYTRI
jgi:hypothetical protein